MVLVFKGLIKYSLGKLSSKKNIITLFTPLPEVKDKYLYPLDIYNKNKHPNLQYKNRPKTTVP